MECRQRWPNNKVGIEELHHRTVIRTWVWIWVDKLQHNQLKISQELTNHHGTKTFKLSIRSCTWAEWRINCDKTKIWDHQKLNLKQVYSISPKFSRITSLQTTVYSCSAQPYMRNKTGISRAKMATYRMMLTQSHPLHFKCLPNSVASSLCLAVLKYS